jgi:hypothetical protein
MVCLNPSIWGQCLLTNRSNHLFQFIIGFQIKYFNFRFRNIGESLQWSDTFNISWHWFWENIVCDSPICDSVLSLKNIQSLDSICVGLQSIVTPSSMDNWFSFSTFFEIPKKLFWQSNYFSWKLVNCSHQYCISSLRQNFGGSVGWKRI